MKKSLLDKQGVDNIIERVEKLRIENSNLWGTMNVTEMLFHCNLSNERIFEEHIEYKKPTIKEQLIKFIGLNIISKFPKNNKGPARTHTKGRIDTTNFEEQKTKFTELIKRFPEHKKPFTSIHPAMGYLTRKEWGIATWMHMDHHLRQFGV